MHHLARGIAALLLTLLLAACGGPVYHTRVLHNDGNRQLKGHQKPYFVNGKRYDPLSSFEGFEQKGVASWYGKKFHGRKTSNGEIYDMHAMTAAHKTLPLGVYVRVTNRENGRRAVVRVNDRGPFVDDRIIDLSYAAAKDLGVVGPGTARVRVEAIGYSPDGKVVRASKTAPQSHRVGSYAVQVGAFSVEDNARSLATELEGRYGRASVHEGWVAGKRFYRVRAGRYLSLEAAEAAAASFKKSGYGSSMVVAME